MGKLRISFKSKRVSKYLQDLHDFQKAAENSKLVAR